jgi:branched-chain amino acid transport system ATP-binding protein
VPALLAAREVWASHGSVPALLGVSVDVPPGHVAAVVGPNGAGKTTLLRVLAGLHRPDRGRVLLRGQDVTGIPAHRLARRDVVLVPERGGVFPSLTVAENLRMAGVRNLDEVVPTFPWITERLAQRAGSLSGGEQQMLALARCLSGEARVVLLDEPSLGLAPRVVDEVFRVVERLRRGGRTVVLVEQYVRRALDVADLVYVLRRGRVAFAGEVGEVKSGTALEAVYLGAGA